VRSQRTAQTTACKEMPAAGRACRSGRAALRQPPRCDAPQGAQNRSMPHLTGWRSPTPRCRCYDDTRASRPGGRHPAHRFVGIWAPPKISEGVELGVCFVSRKTVCAACAGAAEFSTGLVDRMLAGSDAAKLCAVRRQCPRQIDSQPCLGAVALSPAPRAAGPSRRSSGQQSTGGWIAHLPKQQQSGVGGGGLPRRLPPAAGAAQRAARVPRATTAEATAATMETPTLRYLRNSLATPRQAAPPATRRFRGSRLRLSTGAMMCHPRSSSEGSRASRSTR
jgi:hypothetical protein